MDLLKLIWTPLSFIFQTFRHIKLLILFFHPPTLGSSRSVVYPIRWGGEIWIGVRRKCQTQSQRSRRRGRCLHRLQIYFVPSSWRGKKSLFYEWKKLPSRVCQFPKICALFVMLGQILASLPCFNAVFQLFWSILIFYIIWSASGLSILMCGATAEYSPYYHTAARLDFKKSCYSSLVYGH